MRPGFLLLSAVLGATASAAAAQSGLKIDLERHYFPSAAAERESRKGLEAGLARLSSFRGRLAEGPTSLLDALRLYQAIQKDYYRHGLYLQLRCSLDRKDSEACDDGSSLDAIFEARTSFITVELQTLSQDRIEALLSEQPALKPFRYLLELSRRSDPAKLPLATREAIASLRPQLLGWQWPLYQQIVADAPFGTVADDRGKQYDVRRDRVGILTGPDKAVRQRILRAYWTGLSARRDQLAFALIRTASATDAAARLRGFPNAPDASYFDRLLDPPAVRELLAELEKRGGLLKRYQSLRSAGPDPWDAAVVPTRAPSFPLSRIRAIYREAFAGLDPRFVAEFDRLLDPAEARADVAEVSMDGRAGSGFSLGFPGTDAVLFVGRYGGTFKDLSVIAHEGTHAAQRALINASGVLPSYATGPNFLMEGTAIFTELVLADHMYHREKDPVLRRYYLERFLDIKGLSFLFGAQNALFEQRVHDGVGAGTIKDADDLDRIFKETDRNFGDDVSRYPEAKGNWTSRTIAYQDPLYYVNYAYAGLIGLELFRQFRRNPAEFAPRYERFLERGFDAAPATLLEEHFQIGSDMKMLAARAADTVSDYLDALEQRREARPRPRARALSRR